MDRRKNVVVKESDEGRKNEESILIHCLLHHAYHPALLDQTHLCFSFLSFLTNTVDRTGFKVHVSAVLNNNTSCSRLSMKWQLWMRRKEEETSCFCFLKY